MPGVSQRHHQYDQQCTNTYWPAIGFQQQVRDATAANQVPDLLHSCCSQPCHVQETTQNAPF